ncbi:histamine H2 receptor-like [Orbicella faveolata]|uniref:histamine H2 receptor-like n=1 Tax=Orbicella faveolata TaxID=48498 RepID=UPI0009E2B1C4|nr:histamine H2 receptor-like [Orbicella faveolata]
MNDTGKDNNGSADHHSDNEDQASSNTIFKIICLLNVPLMLISILGNAVVLAAIKRTPSVRSTSVILLSSLAVSDLLVGVIGQPIYIADLLTNYSFISKLAIMVGFSVCTVSLLTITAISVDRLLAVHFHLRYPTLATKSRVKYILGMIWLISFVLSGFDLWNKRVYHLLVAPVIFICLIISTCCYIRISQIVRRHQSEIQAQQRSVQNNNDEGDGAHVVELRRSVMSAFVFYIALIICYSPAYSLLTLNGISETRYAWQPEWNFATTVIFVNSAVNPFLYFWRLPKLRKAAFNVLRQMLCKQTEEN